jgi:DNA-binding CsgD family transcriptional regulator
VIDEHTAGIEELVRILVERSAPPVPADGDSQAEEIVLDLSVEGARYLLVRLPAATKDSARLSPREQEIVRLVAEGHSNKIIGDVLNISSWTVCTHLRRIFAKIGVGSRAAMVARIMGTSAARCGKPQSKPTGASRTVDEESPPLVTSKVCGE